MTELQSAVLGTLTQDRAFADWFVAEAAVGMPFFDGLPLVVTFVGVEAGQEAAFLAEADEALKAFRELTTTERRLATELVLANYASVLDAEDHDPLVMEDIDPDGIWRFVHPTEVYVCRRPNRDRELYVQVDCNCDWEQEHGLQLVFRRGRMLTRVSAIDGHLTEADAYGKPDAEDKLLKRFTERFAN